MNNFLSQIIAINQGTANVIQPRIASLFEPIAPSVVPTFSDDAIQVESSPSPPHPSAQEPPVVQPTEVLSQSTERAHDTRLIVVENNVTQQEPALRSIAQPSVWVSPEYRSTMNEPTIQREIGEAQPIVVNQPIAESVPIKSTESRREIVSMVEKSAAPASMIVRPNITLHEQSLVSDSAPAPTIRVTIGRIDVRANIVAPTPSPRVAPSAPKLSLDEYLKSQRRGEP